MRIYVRNDQKEPYFIALVELSSIRRMQDMLESVREYKDKLLSAM